MVDVEESIYLRDKSLEADVRALVADIADHPDRIVVEALEDDADPEYRLSIELYPTSLQQQDEWVTEIRRRLADQLEITDAPTGRDLEMLELADDDRSKW